MDELADWDDFFSDFSTSLRRGLLGKFGLEAKISVEAALAGLSAEARDKLEHFRTDVIALSSPDSKALEAVMDGVRDLETAALDRPNDLAGWLYLHKPALFDSALELLQFDRGMNKPAMWTGFQIDAAFKNASLDPKNTTFLGELSARFSSKIVPTPLVRVMPFQRVSGRRPRSSQTKAPVNGVDLSASKIRWSASNRARASASRMISRARASPAKRLSSKARHTQGTMHEHQALT